MRLWFGTGDGEREMQGTGGRRKMLSAATNNNQRLVLAIVIEYL